MAKVVTDINKIYCGTVRIYPDGQIGHSIREMRLKKSHKDHVMAMVGYGSTPQGVIDRATYISCPKSNDRCVFLEPKARNTRDIVRNSGYKITIDRDKADFIVIPPLQDYQTDYYCADFVVNAVEAKNIYLFTITNDMTSHVDESLGDRIYEKLSQVIPGAEFYKFTDEFSRGTVYFVPNIQSYVDILSGHINKKYIYDKDLDYDALYDINIETLELWRHMTDSDILEKCIIGSNWREFPFTLHTFMEAEKSCRGVCSSQNKNLRMILDETYCNYMWPSQKQIQPNDWNLCQRWIMHLLGTDEEHGGYIDSNRVDTLNYAYSEVLRQRYLVAPFIISSPMEYDNLISHL